jgi:hypothetical protein
LPSRVIAQNKELRGTDLLVSQQALVALADMLHTPENIASSISEGLLIVVIVILLGRNR